MSRKDEAKRAMKLVAQCGTSARTAAGIQQECGLSVQPQQVQQQPAPR